MELFLIDVPVPSMGATVNELTIVDIKVQPGVRVAKGEKIAELESDKSVFEFEAPCDGVIAEINCRAGDILPSGAPFLRIETADASLRHLEAKEDGGRSDSRTVGRSDGRTVGRRAEVGTGRCRLRPGPRIENRKSKIENPMDSPRHEARAGGRARSGDAGRHRGDRSRRARVGRRCGALPGRAAGAARISNFKFKI
jgi:pyruvate/2-oxoglutarate dehydrogenase complex dihydrolipoamide acyltransferase (E2) component